MSEITQDAYTQHELEAALDELADKGYRLLSEEGLRFAEAVLPLAMEVWPEWKEVETDALNLIFPCHKATLLRKEG